MSKNGTYHYNFMDSVVVYDFGSWIVKLACPAPGL